MFSGIYTDTTEGQEAEIGFKTRFVTLALVITLLTFVDIYFYPERTLDVVLKQQYMIVWAIFYMDATFKIRREALSDPPVSDLAYFCRHSFVGQRFQICYQ